MKIIRSGAQPSGKGPGDYLEENIHAADVSLTSEEMGALDAALSPENVSGPRYAPAQQALVNR